IDRDQMCVESAQEENVIEYGESAVDTAAAGAPMLRMMRESPEDSSRGCIKSDHVILSLHRVHDPVYHQRRGLELLQRSGLIDPLQFQILHIRRSDLVQQTMTLAESSSRVS